MTTDSQLSVDDQKLVVIIAGEPSGDLHASQVAQRLKEKLPEIELIGMGGDLMESAGVKLLFHIRDSAVMGISEVLNTIPAFLQKQRDLKKLITTKKPSVVVLVDFGDFNLGIAKFAHQLGIPTIYYIPPKAWAWRAGRAEKLAKTTSIIASIFPFETEFYREKGANVEFVGHPLLDVAQTDFTQSEARQLFDIADNCPVVGLMPGSRWKEIQYLLPIMLEVARNLLRRIPSCRFILPLAPGIDRKFLPNMPFVEITEGAVYPSMRASDLILVASGTSTLEAACIGTPMIIVYKVSLLTWWIIQHFVNLELSGLPNIIAGREIVPELLQDEVTTNQITTIAIDLLENPDRCQKQREELKRVSDSLGATGARNRVADLILNYV
ncbi:TPA: lipid-A-disaccharide synthase [Candidatus Poribacteria bacterium]|nr:lipid-A-disaccharide synthase [Candidatus Poribacteria bacterium]HIA70784.1 lipid-A-disaccharide synthase [Candidatus Poribacteria bacterium]HIC03204.1 lipid-A-disaccharide synthase [Candidatus Poribacteria bacterium]HIN28053.1 lipid-A-disaccharide synthase [Candidatus Poribacteria bacterium]HIO78597.1 lipid-A-disaccharide synthase [Candidatus Poribacteria bacterium]